MEHAGGREEKEDANKDKEIVLKAAISEVSFFPS